MLPVKNGICEIEKPRKGSVLIFPVWYLVAVPDSRKWEMTFSVFTGLQPATKYGSSCSFLVL